MATIKEIKDLALSAARGTAPANYTINDVNETLREELNALAGSLNQFMKNRYDIYDIIIQAADEITPKRVIDALPFAEFKVVGNNEKAFFKKKVGKSRAKKFITQVGLSGVYETFRLDTETFEVPAYAIGGAATIDFERMLDGAEDMMDCMNVLTEGVIDFIYREVQKALRAAMNATGRPTANKVTASSFNGEEMAKLCATVSAYGSPVIFAPPEFVAAMGADAIVPVGTNYQGVYSPSDIEDIHNTGYIKIFRGTPVVQIPQSFVDDNNVETWIDPQLAYVLPAGQEKVVKVVLQGGTQVYDFQNRDQSMEIHMYRKLGVAIYSHHNWGIYQNTGITSNYIDK